MPRNKKQKTRHDASTNGDLTHEEIWDDSALLRSWNDAVKEYEFYHSIHARGEDVEEVLRQAELAESLQSQTEAQPQLPGSSTSQSQSLSQPQHANTHRDPHHPATAGPTASADAEPSSDEEGEIDESAAQSPPSLLPPQDPSSQIHKANAQPKPAVDTMLINGIPVPIEQSPTSPTALGYLPASSSSSSLPRDGRDFRNPAPGSTAALLREVYGRSPEPVSSAQAQQSQKQQHLKVSKDDVAMHGVDVHAHAHAHADNAASLDNNQNRSPNLNVDQTLENIKMAYYWAGYYSGLYDGQRQAAGQNHQPQKQTQ